MICRCKNCNKTISFRNHRGNKLSDRTCGCGGKYERLSYESVDGVNPVFPEETYTVYVGPKEGSTYFQCLKNSKGELFVYDKDHVIPFSPTQLINP